jgi:hypothetical protein
VTQATKSKSHRAGPTAYQRHLHPDIRATDADRAEQKPLALGSDAFQVKVRLSSGLHRLRRPRILHHPRSQQLRLKQHPLLPLPGDSGLDEIVGRILLLDSVPTSPASNCEHDRTE